MAFHVPSLSQCVGMVTRVLMPWLRDGATKVIGSLADGKILDVQGAWSGVSSKQHTCQAAPSVTGLQEFLLRRQHSKLA